MYSSASPLMTDEIETSKKVTHQIATKDINELLQDEERATTKLCRYASGKERRDAWKSSLNRFGADTTHINASIPHSRQKIRSVSPAFPSRLSNLVLKNVSFNNHQM